MTLILAGDKDAAVALVRKEADPAYAKSDKLVTDVEAQIKRLSTAKYSVSEFQTGLGVRRDGAAHRRQGTGREHRDLRFNDTKRIPASPNARINRG